MPISVIQPSTDLWSVFRLASRVMCPSQSYNPPLIYGLSLGWRPVCCAHLTVIQPSTDLWSVFRLASRVMCPSQSYNPPLIYGLSLGWRPVCCAHLTVIQPSTDLWSVFRLASRVMCATLAVPISQSYNPSLIYGLSLGWRPVCCVLPWLCPSHSHTTQSTRCCSWMRTQWRSNVVSPRC